MTKGMRFALFTLCLIGAGSLYFQLATRSVAAQAPQGKFTPYTTVLRETIRTAKGDTHLGSLETRAVRSDGSMVQRLGIGSQGGRILTFATGQKVETKDIDGAGLKSTFGIPSTPEAWLADPARNCAYTFTGQQIMDLRSAGEEILHGYRVVKLIGQNLTMWTALDHGCATLGYRTDFGDGAYSAFELVTFTPGEPASELFSLPDTLIEGPPSARMALQSNGCDSECEATRRFIVEKRDEQYYTARRD